MQLYISYVPENKPLMEEGKPSSYSPHYQLSTQTLPQDVQYRQLAGNIWVFTYSTSTKTEVMKIARWLSRFQVEILGKKEVEDILEVHYTKDNSEYIIVPQDNDLWLQEERLTVDTFDWITVRIPMANFSDFQVLGTQVSTMFSWIERRVNNWFWELSHIESDNPILWSFLTDELITQIEAVGGSVLWL